MSGIVSSVTWAPLPLLALCLLFAAPGLLAAACVARFRRSDAVQRRPGLRPSALAVASLGVALLGAALLIWQEHRDVRASLELYQGPGGELVQVATRVGFEREARGAAAPAAARRLFELGERGLQAKRYRESAEAFSGSAQNLPTAAAYLDLGVARFFLQEFRAADAAFRTAARLARESGSDGVEGACLDGIGLVALRDGQPNAAIPAHRAALDLHTAAGNPAGRAIAHARLGAIHHLQGKPDEAVLAVRRAFGLYTRLESRLGRANALARLADLYLVLGRPADALIDLREALRLDREIDNQIGEIRDLKLLGRAYAMLGQEGVAREALVEAAALAASSRGKTAAEESATDD